MYANIDVWLHYNVFSKSGWQWHFGAFLFLTTKLFCGFHDIQRIDIQHDGLDCNTQLNVMQSV